MCGEPFGVEDVYNHAYNHENKKIIPSIEAEGV